MKLKLFLLLLCFSRMLAYGQPDFEGIVVYGTNVSSRVSGISDASWRRYLGVSDTLVVYIKNGNYRQVYPNLEVYYRPDEQKVYYHHKGIDSLFYVDYAYDSSKVLSVDRFSSVSYINKLPCNKLEVATDQYTITYEYSPTLHLNPIYDTSNTGDRYDEYIKVAQAVYLRMVKETTVYSHGLSASRVSQQLLPDSIFSLPDLPVTKYQFASIGTEPQFKGGIDGYRHFLETHLNGNLAAKYVAIPAGEREATEVVRLRLAIAEDGKVADAQAINRKEVHPFLAGDAEKVMMKIPRLVPATLFGKKIPFVFLASVTYLNIR